MELEKMWGEQISEGGNKFTSIGVFPWGNKFTGKYVPGRTYFGGYKFTGKGKLIKISTPLVRDLHVIVENSPSSIGRGHTGPKEAS